MDLFDSPAAARSWSDGQRRRGRTVALVPTMGALHRGHFALIDEARRHADEVVVSVFVNPLQFNVSADFTGYPRPIDADLAACANSGAAAVYAPTAAAMYPAGFETHVEPGALADGFEGTHRPGHFRGVTTVVAKLFAAVRPDVAVFGRKDAQQLAIIERMNLDLDLGVRIVAMPTIRESDGLAMSSRNKRLSTSERSAAVCIWRGLQAGGRAGRDADSVIAAVRGPIDAEPLARVEYVSVVDPTTFHAIDVGVTGSLIIVAAWFGDVRLIDNAPLPEGVSGTVR